MENIKVSLRVRPLQDRERVNQEENIWQFLGNDTISLNQSFLKELIYQKKATPSSKLTFSFDHCFNTNTQNYDVHDTFVKEICHSSIEGINGTVFMYGQTGSGKTYTMLGDTSKNGEFYVNKIMDDLMKRNQDIGILIFALDYLFKIINNDFDKTYLLRGSYFEIYNENVYDLLRCQNSLEDPLSINEDTVRKEFYIKGLQEEPISTIEDALELIQRGEENRHYAETILNHTSSRSHTIFKLYVQSVSNEFIRNQRRFQQKQNYNSNQSNNFSGNNVNQESLLNVLMQNSIEDGTIVTEGQLNFVDLAGSEKISNNQNLIEYQEQIMRNQFENNEENMHQALKFVKDRIKESQSINKSLFFLTQVISQQSTNKNAMHIPYRNSTLTKILKSSLGGNSRTLIVLCITPIISQFEQSISTMRFGHNAKKIQNKIEPNIRIANYHNNNYNDTDNNNKSIQLDKLKLKDNENYYEQQKEIEELKKYISNISNEKNDILGKLKDLMVKSMEQNGEDFEHIPIVPIQYQDNVGLIFHSKCTQKIEKINANLNKSFCDLIYDYEGKFSLYVSKKLKAQLNLLNDQLLKHQQYLQNQNEKYLNNFRQLTILKDSQQILQNKYNLLQNRYSSLSTLSSQNMQKIELYEKLEGAKDLSDSDLQNLENQMFIILDKLKSEKAKRVYQSEINSLKQKLGINQKYSNQKNSSNPPDNYYQNNNNPYNIHNVSITDENQEGIEEKLSQFILQSEIYQNSNNNNNQNQNQELMSQEQIELIVQKEQETMFETFNQFSLTTEFNNQIQELSLNHLENLFLFEKNIISTNNSNKQSELQNTKQVQNNFSNNLQQENQLINNNNNVNHHQNNIQNSNNYNKIQDDTKQYKKFRSMSSNVNSNKKNSVSQVYNTITTKQKQLQENIQQPSQLSSSKSNQKPKNQKTKILTSQNQSNLRKRAQSQAIAIKKTPRDLTNSKEQYKEYTPKSVRIQNKNWLISENLRSKKENINFSKEHQVQQQSSHNNNNNQKNKVNGGHQYPSISKFQVTGNPVGNNYFNQNANLKDNNNHNQKQNTKQAHYLQELTSNLENINQKIISNTNNHLDMKEQSQESEDKNSLVDNTSARNNVNEINYLSKTEENQQEEQNCFSNSKLFFGEDSQSFQFEKDKRMSILQIEDEINEKPQSQKSQKSSLNSLMNPLKEKMKKFKSSQQNDSNPKFKKHIQNTDSKPSSQKSPKKSNHLQSEEELFSSLNSQTIAIQDDVESQDHQQFQPLQNNSITTFANYDNINNNNQQQQQQYKDNYNENEEEINVKLRVQPQQLTFDNLEYINKINKQ